MTNREQSYAQKLNINLPGSQRSARKFSLTSNHCNHRIDYNNVNMR